MRECATGDPTYRVLSVIRTDTEAIAIFLLISVIMVYICKQVHLKAGRLASKLVTIGHTIYISVLGLFLVCSLSLESALPFVEVGRHARSALYNASRGLGVTYNLLALLGILMASINLLFALFRCSQLRRSVSPPR